MMMIDEDDFILGSNVLTYYFEIMAQKTELLTSSVRMTR